MKQLVRFFKQTVNKNDNAANQHSIKSETRGVAPSDTSLKYQQTNRFNYITLTLKLY